MQICTDTLVRNLRLCYSEIRQEETESESIKARKTETQIAA